MTSSSEDITIRLDDVWLYYPLLLRRKQNSRVRFQCLLHDLFHRRGQPAEENFFPALQGVSFELKRGECIGLIGPNGAGKSTMLRVLAGIEEPDRGTVEVRGRVSSLLSLGVGIKPQLSGRENIRVNSMLLGIDAADVESYMSEVIAMADLGAFIDAPVQTYSSGMRSRLGFAVATRLQPEILLLDEVFGAGDATFKARTGSLLQHYRAQQKTVVLATHSNEFILNNCDRAIFLRKGQIEAIGPAEEVIASYQRFSDTQIASQRRFAIAGSGSAEPAGGAVGSGVKQRDADSANTAGVESRGMQLSNDGSVAIDKDGAQPDIPLVVPFPAWRDAIGNRADAAHAVGVLTSTTVPCARLVEWLEFQSLVARRKQESLFQIVEVQPSDWEDLGPEEASRLLPSVLLVPDHTSLTSSEAQRLCAWIAAGGVLVSGPRALTAISDDPDGSEDRTNYGLTALHGVDAAAIGPRVYFGAVRAIEPSPFSGWLGEPDSAPGEGHAGEQRDDVALTEMDATSGSLLLGKPDAVSIASAFARDPERGMSLGSVGVCMMRRVERGVVVRTGFDWNPRIPILTELLHMSLTRARVAGLATVDSQACVPAVEATASMIAHDRGASGPTIRLQMSPFAPNSNGLELLPQEMLAEVCASIAAAGVREVCLPIKSGDALVPGLGIDAYACAQNRDFFAEWIAAAEPLGIEVTPVVNAFSEHWPNQPSKPTGWIEAHPDCLHGSMRQAGIGLETAADFAGRGERILSSPHAEGAIARICDAVRAVGLRYERRRLHIEFFRFGNDAGGFLKEELAAKRRLAESLGVAGAGQDHVALAARTLRAVGDRVLDAAGEVDVSIEAYHESSFGLPAPTLTLGILTKKPIPATAWATWSRVRRRDVAQHRTPESCEVMIDPRRRHPIDVRNRIAAALVGGWRQLTIVGVTSADVPHLNDWLPSGGAPINSGVTK